MKRQNKQLAPNVIDIIIKKIKIKKQGKESLRQTEGERKSLQFDKRRRTDSKPEMFGEFVVLSPVMTRLE